VRVHLLFLDESGRLEQDGIFGLGGIAVRDTEWHRLRDVWQDTLRTHGWPLDLELKWHGIRTGKVPPALASAIVAALAQGPFKAYVVLLDLPRGRELFPEYFATPEDCYSTALMLLAERFHHLLAAEDDVGLIVVDSRFREDDSRLRRFFADLTESGTPFMKLDRIIEGLFLGPSHHSIGLQCADLVTAIATSAERGNGQGRGYLKTLLPRFATHPATGSLDGVGIKRFPDTVAPERPKHRLF
jgi:Protein of unknown function (DUF3800)